MTLTVHHTEQHLIEGRVELTTENIVDAVRHWLKEQLDLPEGTAFFFDIGEARGTVDYRHIVFVAGKPRAPDAPDVVEHPLRPETP